MTYRLQRGLEDSYRQAAAALYWQAFGGKLGPVLGPEPRAIAYIARVLRLDHCIAAIQDGQVLGIAGFRSDKGSFAGGTAADLRAIYGGFGAVWRMVLLLLLSGDDDHFLLDGLSVDAAARGQGIGAALIAAIADLGRQTGHTSLILDVVASNMRARQLYASQGFTIEKITRIGLLRLIFGFDRVVTMVKDLREP